MTFLGINLSEFNENSKGDNPSQNFGLSEMEFTYLVQKLHQRDESLLEKVYKTHCKECIKYLMNNYSLDYDIAYDTTMDTMIEFRKKLMESKISYGNLRYLFTRMASQILLKANKADTKIKNIIPEIGQDDNGLDVEEKIIILKKAWDELSSEDRLLLEQHYYNDIPLIKIAESQNKTDVALRKQKQRAIEKLRNCFFSKDKKHQI